MYLTISGFYNIYKDKLSLVCGQGGMTRRVGSAGILDYEFLPEVLGKYRHSNFQKDQLVITTFLYARDNEFLIGDAVKNLIAKGVSGLVIKNVFRLPIHETVLRYADSKNFPIFVSDSAELIFEDFIYDVTSSIRKMEALDFVQREIDATLAAETTEAEAYNHGLNLNPSLENQHMVFYVPMDVEDPGFSYLRYAEAYQGSALDRPEHLLTLYDGGFLFLYSWEKNPLKKEQIVSELEKLLGLDAQSAMGISRTHYYLGELKASIREALYSARVAEDRALKDVPGSRRLFFGDLGSLRILFSYCYDSEMEDFRRDIMDPLEVYDVENRGRLRETLFAYCEHDYSFPETARALSQHVNTVRYRMDKVGEITGLSYKNPQEMQQLDLAYKIGLCQELLENS
ncbi:MAG: PucR family transcriptional regulator [Eubacterium sp.]|nr:PucR family transcriptional regulator [Eubacterium sp.]